MIYVIESSDTFNSKLYDSIKVKNGDILPSKYLNTLPGMSASDDVAIIIDNSVKYGYYRIVDENGDIELRCYDKPFIKKIRKAIKFKVGS